jgi:hypothetical protein
MGPIRPDGPVDVDGIAGGSAARDDDAPAHAVRMEHASVGKRTGLRERPPRRLTRLDPERGLPSNWAECVKLSEFVQVTVVPAGS